MGLLIPLKLKPEVESAGTVVMVFGDEWSADANEAMLELLSAFAMVDVVRAEEAGLDEAVLVLVAVIGTVVIVTPAGRWIWLWVALEDELALGALVGLMVLISPFILFDKKLRRSIEGVSTAGSWLLPPNMRTASLTKSVLLLLLLSLLMPLIGCVERGDKEKAEEEDDEDPLTRFATRTGEEDAELGLVLVARLNDSIFVLRSE